MWDKHLLTTNEIYEESEADRRLKWQTEHLCSTYATALIGGAGIGKWFATLLIGGAGSETVKPDTANQSKCSIPAFHWMLHCSDQVYEFLMLTIGFLMNHQVAYGSL